MNFYLRRSEGIKTFKFISLTHTLFIHKTIIDFRYVFRCGDSQCYFYMEVGRHSAIGPGELWMGTEDPLIAQNMHTTIIGYAKEF